MIRFRSLALIAALSTVTFAAHADGKKDKPTATPNAKDKPAEAAPVEKGKWEKLGERQVDGKIDKDTIAVGREDGIYDSIRLKVEGSALEMFDVKITFGNGQTFEPKTKLVFGKDSWTRVIDLPGEKRIIRKVELKYGNLPGGGKARVEFWGREVDEAEQGWEKLGQRQVDGKLEKDTIPVGLKDGVFTGIRVKVEGSALEMFDIKLTFGNGQTFEPKTKLIFGKDSWTRVIDLPGEKRIITKVELKYGNLPGGGKARVEFWGKR